MWESKHYEQQSKIMAKKNNLRIAEILKSKGWTLGDLAKRMSELDPNGKLLTKSTLSGRINGNPTLSNLYEVAEALDVKITELFPKEDQVCTTLGFEDSLKEKENDNYSQSEANVDEYVVKTSKQELSSESITFCPHCGGKVRVGVVLLSE